MGAKETSFEVYFDDEDNEYIVWTVPDDEEYTNDVAEETSDDDWPLVIDYY